MRDIEKEAKLLEELGQRPLSGCTVALFVKQVSI
jgi:hypothetical protein